MPLSTVMEQVLAHVQSNAQKSGGASSAAEAKDFAIAAYNLAQAAVILDPARLAGGASPAAQLASVPKPPPARPQPARAQPTKDANANGVVGA